MALKPKTAVFQVRVDPELLIRFQLLCESKQTTVSDAIRRMMLGQLERYEKELEHRRHVQAVMRRSEGA
jgi:hypothetical protein